ncbi:ATP-binding cassette domain-containing protein [Lentilactobacillus sp. Marseille-Q4993]|uniref:metal ABC transporter ATP-binding protein n=1 Tax=Lentilactobacillus sp. Marseille-Q4993 TaxID=3039492 RepID=UPI0024BC215E|nr:ATP-binding cassette domain-containing protein [Lentilactobacillus sp. Marseille-Q4993]
MTSELIKVNNLEVAFSGRTLFKNLTFAIDQGEFLTVIGENGIGKTTLIRVLLNKLRPTTGTVFRSKNIKVGYVPQFRNIDVEYPLSIRDFIALSFTGIKLPFLSGRERKAVERVIKLTGLTKIADHPLGLSSGGEKQKAYLASALVNEPNLLILDESTASLDPNTKIELLDMISKINREEHVSVLFVTHDLSLIDQYPDHFLWIKKDGYVKGTMAELPSEVKENHHV